MKLSRKRLREIESALEDAANETAERYIRDFPQRPPDDWSKDETLAFDVAHDVKERLRAKIRGLFST